MVKRSVEFRHSTLNNSAENREQSVLKICSLYAVWGIQREADFLKLLRTMPINKEICLLLTFIDLPNNIVQYYLVNLITIV